MKVIFLQDNKKELSSLVLFNQVPHYEFFEKVANDYTNQALDCLIDPNKKIDSILNIQELCNVNSNPVFCIQNQIFKELMKNLRTEQTYNCLCSPLRIESKLDNLNVKSQESFIKSLSDNEKDQVYNWLKLSSILSIGNQNIQNEFENMYEYNIEAIHDYIVDECQSEEIVKFNIRLFISMFISKVRSFQFVHPKVFDIRNSASMFNIYSEDGQ